MKACTRCAKPILPTAIVCPHCGAGIAPDDPYPTGRKGVIVDDDGPSFPVIKVGLVLFALGLLAWWLVVPSQFPQIDLKPAAANPSGYDQCEGKERCIMVFLTPWCSACKQSISTVKGMMARCANSTEVGVKPIVGSGRSAASMEEFAAKIGQGVFLDPAGQVLSAMGERSVPQWLVLDHDRSVVKKQAGVIPNVDVMFKQLDLPDCSLGD